jgi:hypothetical protein
MQVLRNKGQCSVVGPAQSKGKRLPIYTLRKHFSAQTVTVSAVRVLVVCSPTSSSPALLLWPAVASSRLSPPPSPLAHELTHAAAARRITGFARSTQVRALSAVADVLLHSPSRSLRECRRRRQPVPPASPAPQVRTLQPPPPLLPWLHQSHDRTDTSHAVRYVHPSLNCLPSSLFPPEGDFVPFFFF